MTEEVTTILERWHNSDGFSCSHPGEVFEKIYCLAAAYAQEHPADDVEMVTEEWLRSVGFHEGITSQLRLGHLFVNGNDNYGFEFDYYKGNRALLPNIYKTRSNVRLLCRALGIRLREPA